MIYEWKTASRIKADAQAAGAVFEELEQTVGLTNKTLLEASRPAEAPLHNEFEWNDGVAAEKYREEQAGHLIRCICIKSEDSSEKQVRAFFKTAEEKPEFTRLSIILQDAEKTENLLAMARKELIAFQKKYNALAELAPVFRAIKEVV